MMIFLMTFPCLMPANAWCASAARRHSRLHQPAQPAASAGRRHSRAAGSADRDRFSAPRRRRRGGPAPRGGTTNAFTDNDLEVRPLRPSHRRM